MIWRIMNWLFGMQYVLVTFGGYQFVRRVEYTPTGRPYVICCGNWIFLDGNPQRDVQRLT